MSSDHNAHVGRYNEIASARRGIEIAKNAGLGPFGRGHGHRHNTETPAQQPVESASQTPRRPRVAEFGKWFAAFALPDPFKRPLSLVPEVRINRHSFDSPYFEIVIGGFDIYMSYSPDKSYLSIRNEEKTKWFENYGSIPMNKAAMDTCIFAIESSLDDDEAVGKHLESYNRFQYGDKIISKDAFLEMCHEAVTRFRSICPQNGPLKTPKKYSHEERQDLLRHSYHGFSENRCIPEKPFPDSKPEIVTIPYFAEDGTTWEMDAAFRFHRGGKLYWVQFRNPDGSLAADFLRELPRDQFGERKTENVSKENALQCLEIIAKEIEGGLPEHMMPHMKRLATAAHEQDVLYQERMNKSYDIYFKDMGIFKDMVRVNIAKP